MLKNLRTLIQDRITNYPDSIRSAMIRNLHGEATWWDIVRLRIATKLGGKL